MPGNIRFDDGHSKRVRKKQFHDRSRIETHRMHERMECGVSSFGEGYVFRHRTNRIAVGKRWLPLAESDTWNNPEETGCWTKEESRLTLDTTNSFSALEIDATNHHPVRHVVDVIYGNQVMQLTFEPGEHKIFSIDAKNKVPTLIFRSKALIPAQDYGTASEDIRALGIFVRVIDYL